MYRQVLDPVGHSLAWSALVAAIPLLLLVFMLGVLRITAWISSLVALAAALVVAIAVYPMPASQGFLAASLGAVSGFFPILWIVINAIWIYNMTVYTGHFDVLRRSFGGVSDDKRIQAIIIAFCFGALMEALAGFGTPVAITAVMLIALGFTPMRAAVLALVANTAPVAFGALATPIVTLSTVSGLDVNTVGSMVGRQTPILALFVPLVLVALVDGRRGMRQTWPAAIVCGAAFGLAQYVTSNFISVQLSDIVASLFAAAAVVALLRVWQPGTSGVPAVVPEPVPTIAGGSVDVPDEGFKNRVEKRDSPGQIALAYAPYVIIVAIFCVVQLPPIIHRLNTTTRTWSWPGLHIENAAGKVSTLPLFKFNWLTAAGTLMLIAGILTMIVLRVTPWRAIKLYGQTLNQLKWAIVTVMAVLALAFVMNASGETATLGNWLANAGKAFAFLSPILGWLGVAVTGSDTSSNSLFGALQVSAAHQAGLNPVLMAGSNSSGGVLGKMISPQNLAIAASAVGITGKEGDLFRKVVLWSIVFLLGMCVLVYLQSTAVLSWMVP
ncbi:MAG TPA: L-lactate permease [Micromonosporaceae bacterium]|nr:L-lactate permease [Micromonosporaceae bacterium]